MHDQLVLLKEENMEYDSALAGVGLALPERIVTCEELEASSGFDKLNIRKGMAKLLSGVSERRIAEPGVNSSDLAAEAAVIALKEACIEPSEVEMVIFASISQDLIEPATVNIVMDKINIRNAKGIDVKNACNAFISSIEIANMYIKCGDVKNVLITSGELLSRYVRLDFSSIDELKNVNSTFSVGDAGGAIVLKRVERSQGEDRIQTIFRTFPDTWADGALLGGGTMFLHDSDKSYAQNESREMIQLNFVRGMEFYEDAIKKMKINLDEISLFIPPQITKYLIIRVSEHLKLPADKVANHIGTLGNISTASFPAALSQALSDGRLHIGSGQKVLCLGAANGFSAGVLYMTI